MSKKVYKPWKRTQYDAGSLHVVHLQFDQEFDYAEYIAAYTDQKAFLTAAANGDTVSETFDVTEADELYAKYDSFFGDDLRAGIEGVGDDWPLKPHHVTEMLEALKWQKDGKDNEMFDY